MSMKPNENTLNITIKKRLKTIFWIFALLCGSVAADPIIQVDSPNVDVGGIRQDKVKEIRYTFLIKNVGSDTLVIKKVKPG